MIRDESLIRLVNDSVRVEILSLGASLRRFELRQALHAVQPGQNDVVNLGAGVGYGVQEVLDACREVTGHPIPAVERGLRTGDPPTLVTSNVRARELLGWTQRLDLHRLVADAWAFLRDGAAGR